MASRMRILYGRLPGVSVYYNGGLKTVNGLIRRGYSAHGRSSEPVVVFEAQSGCPEQHEIFVKKYDDKFGEQFRYFPLPGSATTSQHFLQIKEKSSISAPKTTSCLQQSDILTTPMGYERQITTFYMFSEASRKLPPIDAVPLLALPSSAECAAFSCPELVRKDFAELFPYRDVKNSVLTVVTLTQRTVNDMSERTERTDEEREQLSSQFVSTASSICDFLQREGYWAEFIDPTTGRPYLGPFTDATLFETDDRYRYFGFMIDDLGYCKIIRHELWGSNVMVGSIYCNAPLDSPVLKSLLPQQREIIFEQSPIFALPSEEAATASDTQKQHEEKAAVEYAAMDRAQSDGSEMDNGKSDGPLESAPSSPRKRPGEHRLAKRDDER